MDEAFSRIRKRNWIFFGAAMLIFVLGASVNGVFFLGIVPALAGTLIGIKELSKKQALWFKYFDADLVERIYSHTIWQGQTREQLIDSIGSPIVVDTKVLKNSTKETWKYVQYQKGRFKLKVIVEDGSVVGWEKKA